MPVIDELYIRNGTNRVPVDSIDNKAIEEIVINDQIYHFAKESAASGVDSVVCENAVNEPFRSIEAIGDTAQSILPLEYQQIEYLRSTGTQYIDTGVIPDNETGFSIDMSLDNMATDRFLFGCRQNSGEYSRFVLGVNQNIYFGFGMAVNNYDKWKVNINTFFNAKLNFLNSRVANVNDNNDLGINPLKVAITYSIIMFGRNSAGSISSSAQTIKACKISQGDAIIRDFIPCYRKVDGVAGMYDLVEGVFYTNAGTGTFTKGANYTIQPTPDNPIDIVNAGDNGLEIRLNDTTLSIPSTVGDLDLRFAKYDDTNKDSLVVDGVNKKVIYKQYVNKINITGEEAGWYAWANRIACPGKNITISSELLPTGKGTDKVGLLCNYLPEIKASSQDTAIGIAYYNDVNNRNYWWAINLGQPDLETTTAKLQEFATNNNPLYVTYLLNTPIVHDITKTPIGQQLLALAANKGTNILEITGATSLDVSYWRQVLPDEEI